MYRSSRSSLSERINRVKALSQGRWREILVSFGIDEKILLKPNHPCPLCGGRDRFSFTDRYANGAYYCRGCGAGDGIDLIQKMLGVGFMGAIEKLEAFLGIEAAPERDRRTADGGDEKTSAHEQAPHEVLPHLALWSSSAPIRPEDPVWNYLKARGLDPSRAGCEIRYSPKTPYCEDGEVSGEYPALIARITNVQGVVVNVQRIYLDAELTGQKAPVLAPKKIMEGSVRGATVQLGAAGAVLGIAEGVETALAAGELFGCSVWAALSVTNMVNFADALPKSVREVLIFADNDENYAGQAGAYTLAHKLKSKGISVRVMIPEIVGEDWLDYLNRSRQRLQETTFFPAGKNAVPAAFSQKTAAWS